MCARAHTFVCIGAVEELVASHKLVLQEEQTRSQQLEEREKELQQEVRSLILTALLF